MYTITDQGRNYLLRNVTLELPVNPSYPIINIDLTSNYYLWKIIDFDRRYFTPYVDRDRLHFIVSLLTLYLLGFRLVIGGILASMAFLMLCIAHADMEIFYAIRPGYNIYPSVQRNTYTITLIEPCLVRIKSSTGIVELFHTGR